MDFYQKIVELKNENLPFVAATVVEMKGSVPGKVGFKILIEPKGKTTGTVGGGAIEAQVIKDAKEILTEGIPQTKEYLLSDKKENPKEDVIVVPMSCSGRVKIFFDVHGQLPSVYVFGGGHVGQALLKILSGLKYFTILIDNRTEYASKDINSSASKIMHSDYVKYASEFSPAENSFIVILTHGHKYDYEILHTIYKRKLKVKYIGVIASKSKAERIINKLKKELNPDLSNLHSPVGLQIGGDSAYEIALSIASEMQSILYKSIAK
jgi:xanthine dehydrogenase accessory factor